MAPSSAVLDGRTARAERTRQAVVEAMLALIAEGDLRPTGARVAERAGVSLRSVFQHFEDLEALLAAVVTHQTDRISELMTPLAPDGPLAERIRALVDQRAKIYEFIAPTRRAAVLQEPFSTNLRQGREALLARSADQLARTFGPELAAADDRPELVSALAVATAWETWDHLRRWQNLSVAATKRVMTRTATALLS